MWLLLGFKGHIKSHISQETKSSNCEKNNITKIFAVFTATKLSPFSKQQLLLQNFPYAIYTVQNVFFPPFSLLVKLLLVLKNPTQVILFSVKLPLALAWFPLPYIGKFTDAVMTVNYNHLFRCVRTPQCRECSNFIITRGTQQTQDLTE